jgi:hypothetical protein
MEGRYITNGDGTATVEIRFKENGPVYSAVFDPEQHKKWHWMALNKYWGKLFHSSKKHVNWAKESVEDKDEILKQNIGNFRQHLKDSGLWDKLGMEDEPKEE